MSTQSDLVARIEGIDVQSLDPDDEAKLFFRSQQEDLSQSISDDDVVGLGNIFYTALGSKLSGIDLRDEFQGGVETHLTELVTDTGGYYELTDDMLEGVNKWNAKENEPTALGTAYSILVAHLLDIPYPNTPTDTVDWWTEHVDDNGLFINKEWSDAKLRYRYPSEYLCEAFLTHVAAGLLTDEEGTPFLSTDNITAFIEDEGLFSTAQLAAEYYAVRLLEMAGQSDSVDVDELSSLLEEHKDEVEAGYSDYLLSEKKDEQSGSKSRTGRDSVNPHIDATVQALILSDRYDLKSKSEIDQEFASLMNHDELNRESGGYGFPIYVREYESPYGPVETPRTTYYTLLGQTVF